MTGMRDHSFGCTCASHTKRPWRRSEHWTPAQVELIERYFGLWTDERLAAKVGRSVVGLRLKAKRLGVKKRQHGFTAREVAAIFGVDDTIVSKVWIRRGLLKASRGSSAYRPCWIVRPEAVEAFIADFPQWIDVDRMPESPYRDRATLWISLPEVFRLTGRYAHDVAARIRAGEIIGRRRGQVWFIPATELAKIDARRPDEIAESVFRRESVLEVRRNRRKGVLVPA